MWESIENGLYIPSKKRGLESLKIALNNSLRSNNIFAENRAISPNGEPFAWISMTTKFQNLIQEAIRLNVSVIHLNGRPFAWMGLHSHMPLSLVKFCKVGSSIRTNDHSIRPNGGPFAQIGLIRLFQQVCHFSRACNILFTRMVLWFNWITTATRTFKPWRHQQASKLSGNPRESSIFMPKS